MADQPRGPVARASAVTAARACSPTRRHVRHRRRCARCHSAAGAGAIPCGLPPSDLPRASATLARGPFFGPGRRKWPRPRDYRLRRSCSGDRRASCVFSCLLKCPLRSSHRFARRRFQCRRHSDLTPKCPSGFFTNGDTRNAIYGRLKSITLAARAHSETTVQPAVVRWRMKLDDLHRPTRKKGSSAQRCRM